MTTHASPGYDLAAIKERLPMARVCVNEGVEMRKSGTWFVGFCPFHDEKTPSFQIGSLRPDRATCRGCGWSGDIFEFWMAKREVDFKTAVRELAQLAGLSLPVQGKKVEWRRPQARLVTAVAEKAAKPAVKPPLPPMRMLRDAEIEQLAKRRGLSVQGVKVAAHDFKRVGACQWPQYERFRGWEPKSTGAWPSWVATDQERRVAEYRRLDGELYPLADGRGIKAWSTAGKSWPLGAADMGTRSCVLLVEGGPDMLAAYHFLWGFRLLDRVAVVCMLGASNRIAEDALPYFRGKRVRIIEDADEEKAVRRPVRSEKGEVKSEKGEGEIIKKIRPGREAAARWTKQLTAAGAAVTTFELYGLNQADGTPVKDLNHVALCNAETVGSDDVRDAFFEWDF